MEVGSCYLTYDDFIKSFKVYKEKSKNHYCIQQSEAVRLYNSKHNANVRRDVMFIEAKFGCLNVRKDRHKRESPESTCPAYFILRYDKKKDHLIITEVDDNHDHSEGNGRSCSSLTSPAKRPVLSNPCSDMPSGKAPGKVPCEPQSDARSDQGSSDKKSPTQDAVPLQKEHPLKFKCNTSYFNEDIARSATHHVKISEDAVKRIASLMQTFLRCDAGSKATITIGTQQEIEQLCFQTSKMSDQFLKFSESLLIHRVHVKYGYVLYAFLVETKERVGKIVHFSFIRSDNAPAVARILRIFQDFNPEWNKVKIIFTDVGFNHAATLKELFPSAQALLSVYHTVNFIERNIIAKLSFKEWLHRLIEEAIFFTSPEKLSFLQEKLKPQLDASLFEYLLKNWFSCELLWYTHTKKGLHSCSTYMDSLDMVLGKISKLLEKQSSMESVIKQFVENADCFNTKGLENQKDCAVRSSSKNIDLRPPIKKRKRNYQPKPCTGESTAPMISVETFNTGDDASNSTQTDCVPDQSVQKTSNGLKDSQMFPPFILSMPTTNANNPVPDAVSPTSPKDADNIYRFLQNHCNDLGFSLCLKEWEIVQKSTQVIKAQGKIIGVQIQEESHEVLVDGQSCTCYFNSRYKLPCRHILSMLYAQKRPVERSMIPASMQKNTPTRDTQLCLTGREDKSTERALKISSLTKELSNLLHQCEESEKSVRCSIMQMIVDMWSKESSAEDARNLKVLGSAQFPPNGWIKTEPQEGEYVPDGHELHRLNACPSRS
uniref:Zinc finger SWIM-type containing 3 n=1 Tax=Leptobrachium leishanense TaxID=445787 RepID=A0A8C5RBI9_9ANUR